LVPSVAFSLLAYVVLGKREPIYAPVVHPEQAFLVVTLVGGITHGVQYLGIVFSTNKRRHDKSPIGRSLWFSYGGFVLVSIAYVGLSAARGAAPGFSLFAPQSPVAQTFMALYWGLFFHHYYLDQKIWRPQNDPELRRDFGLEVRAPQPS